MKTAIGIVLGAAWAGMIILACIIALVERRPCAGTYCPDSGYHAPEEPPQPERNYDKDP
jgi:hypothetical protein